MGTLQENIIYNNIKRLCDNSVPRVSFSKMCVDLGLSKSLGTKLKENPEKTINSETAQKIADYFGVSIDRVLGTDQKEKASANAEVEDTKITDETLKFALWGDASNIDDADLEDVRRYAAFIAERKNNKK